MGNRLRGKPVIRPCVVCQQPIPAERRRRATCSEPCEVDRARETAREHYRRLVAAMPDYNVIRGERIRARAAADPEYAARIREGWRVRGANRLARAREDEAYHAALRRQARAWYAEHAADVYAARRARFAGLPAEERQALAARAREYYRAYAARRRAAESLAGLAATAGELMRRAEA